jgi:2-oxoglutarate dehydrogenase E2 component (dihydrolipoamide succinyltransferase)
MPQLGETVLEGTVATWHKKPGEPIAKGDLLLDVETDKAATEREAPADGVLASIKVNEGQTVDVGTVLAVISAEGETVAEEGPVEDAGAAPADAPADSAPPRGLPAKSSDGRLSPAVRRLLKQNNLNIADIPGTGRDGRVTKQDVQKFIDEAPAAKPPTPTPAAAQPAGEGTRIPFDRIRRVTAAHMVQSKATSPHVLQTIDVDFTAVDKVRLARKDAWKAEKGYSMSYLPFVARAVCKAIRDFPNVNASVDGDALLVHGHLNLAVAIDLDFEGLVAPVVRDAGELSVPALAESFNALIGKAKSRKLTADELQGGTYTLSNPGPFGTFFTSAIINQPQVAILSMDAIKKRPVVIEMDGQDSIAIRPIGVLAHSFDHRAVDGAYSAAFLNRVKTIVEQSNWADEFS